MIAITVRGGAGPAEALEPVAAAVPRPGPGQVLIRVAAAGVNRPDVLQRNGGYPPPPGSPDTLGLEVAGEVAAVGEGAARWRVGDTVCALLGGGGYAEYAVVDARHALPIPAGLDLVQAAALPETAFTVFSNVFEIGRLQAGETLMLHGATSGIGVMAIQMAKAAGARVIATGRSAQKAAAARSFGADVVIDTSAEDFVARVQAEGGADVVLDMVAGDFVQKNLECLNLDGRLVQIAVQAGSKATIDVARLMVRRLTFAGSTLRPRHPDEKARLAAAVEARVWPWIAAGEIRPVIDSTFPLKEAAQAHARLESAGHVGKIMLIP
ncbi:MAG: NAD(P)H-quinone oxidoreductase [Caulobacterales bacterium 32-69-10]|nr:MAG: NAD(P)H-quinone oxidoreductase [Caulobacterales bacterium 32-69-10]